MESDPLDQWMDFFCNAMGSKPEELRQRLPSPIFDEAIGVLEMISKSQEQRRLYYARLKWELDENTRRISLEEELAARLAEGMAAQLAEGLAEGIDLGKAEGKSEQILMLRRFLGEESSDRAALLALDLDKMDDLIRELQEKLQNRLR